MKDVSNNSYKDRNDLIRTIAAKTGRSLKDTKEFVEATEEVILDILASYPELRLYGVGTFVRKDPTVKTFTDINNPEEKITRTLSARIRFKASEAFNARLCERLGDID